MMSNFFKVFLPWIIFCLISSTVARQAIINGDLATQHEFPYYILLEINGIDYCGGGIIGEEHILTAAHCVVKENGEITSDPTIVLTGTINMIKLVKPAMKIEVKKIFVPTEYNVTNIFSSGDIAVLKLKHPLGLSHHHHLKQLRLPRNLKETRSINEASIAGFGWNWIVYDGKTEKDGGNKDGFLRHAEVDILNQGQNCYSKRVIPDRQICARIRQLDPKKPRGVCHGDSGGPLVHDNTLLGILSIGPHGCTEVQDGAIYTRVTYYLDFISHALKDKHRKDIRTLEKNP